MGREKSVDLRVDIGLKKGKNSIGLTAWKALEVSGGVGSSKSRVQWGL